MAVAAVRRVHIIAHEATKDSLLERLQTEGILHVESLREAERVDVVEPVTAETREIDKKIADVESAVGYLGRFSPPQSFISSLAGGRVELSPARFNEYSADDAIDNTLERIRAIQQERADLEVRRARLVSVLNHLEPWRDLDVPLEMLRSSSAVDVFSGSVPVRSVEPLHAALSDTGESWILHQVSSAGGRTYIVLISLRDDGRDADRILREHGFQLAMFPQGKGTAASIQGTVKAELATIKGQDERLGANAAELSGERIKLMAAYDRLIQSRQRIETAMTAHGTKESIVLSGWMRIEDKPRLLHAAESVSRETVVIDRSPSSDEEPPVAMVNKPLVEPFRVVTNLYGLPKSREIDPTPLLAPFFAVSFGIAIGEGGYGVLLALLSKLGLKFLKLGEGGRRLLNLLFYCGIVTFVAGVLMGSFFAIGFDKLPDSHWLRVAHDHAQLLNPLEDSLLFLGIVLGIGFLQVWFGVLIGGIIKWRS
jgi:V/A-type H+-transporting ATPase subunit I